MKHLTVPYAATGAHSAADHTLYVHYGALSETGEIVLARCVARRLIDQKLNIENVDNPVAVNITWLNGDGQVLSDAGDKIFRVGRLGAGAHPEIKVASVLTGEVP